MWKTNRFLRFAGLFLIIILPWSDCAGTAQPQVAQNLTITEDARMQALQQTFDHILGLVDRDMSPDSLKPMLTEQSQLWIEEMEGAAISEPRLTLETRPFNEILTIVAYRILERDGRLSGVYKDRMLSLAAGRRGLLRKAMGLKLGAFEIKNDRGTRGVASSPKVPVLFFQWEDNRWKLDLVATLPIITRGIETIGIKKEWTPTRTILYLLDKIYRDTVRFDIDESLMDPNRI